MTGTIELDPDGKTLQIRFPYRPDLVEDVKRIPGRRWDRDGKLWRVPTGQVENVLAVLMRHGFSMSSDVSSLLAGTQGTLPLPATAAEPGAAAPETVAATGTGIGAAESAATATAADALSISALNDKVRTAVQAGFPEPVWVVGEIADFDKNQDRQHLFFTLLEKRGESIVARVSVAMFERTARMLRTRLASLAEPMSLADGIEIRALVKVDVYPRNGRYQLVIEDIDATFTLGKLALGREEILRELREKALDVKNRGLPLPVPMLRIAVLTSQESDGWNDFLATLQASRIGFQVTCYDARVQGERLKPSMLQGLRYFAARSAEFDALCIVRGGGSRTDLAWFDDRDVAIAVANHPLKTICGIGHHRDQSVLDCITHSEKTPTAVAEFLVAQVLGAREVLADLSRCFVDLVRRFLAVAERRLADCGHRLRHRVQGALIFERERLQAASRRIGAASRGALRTGQDHLVRRGERLRNASTRHIERARALLAIQGARCRLLDPRLVLTRGYTLARNAQGRIVTNAAALRPGAALAVEFRDGSAWTTVDSIGLADHTD